ncbi:flavodoxin family protein [Pseudoblastomonas halimionae]|uniref:Flavodoxin family protein n=1 Tax=Alteriqipengyuania halimionae TaxID=1926630 RepID=A0A6I4U0X5_9SPHN|nr:NAD(P)H-dependent oxidoreductase [Alteriqipengyuania halimionae]MXP09416.1 flavodoxin family protein [Alteriqipengyuania halimionae]
MLAILWHSRTGTAEALACAAQEGASERARMLAATEASPDDLLDADGYLFVCPENLASMSGAMKEMFDTCYYPLLGKIEGRPFATIIAAGSDGEGAQAQIDRIAKGWRLKRAAPHMIVIMDAQTPEAILAQKTVPDDRLSEARELGEAFAEGLELGIF